MSHHHHPQGKGLAVIGVARLLARAVYIHQQGDHEGALVLYKRVLQLDPRNLDALYGASILAWQHNEPEAGIRWLRQYVARRPEHADAWYNLGCMLQQTQQHLDALAAYEHAVRHNPKLGTAWSNLGTLMKELGDYESAMACMAKAIELVNPASPDYAQAVFNSAYALIATGRWKEGWAAYEARFEVPVFKGIYTIPHPFPVWDGEQDLAGRTILFCAEQGFGDTIQFLRYVPQLKARGALVRVEVQPPLLQLAAASLGDVPVYPQGTRLPLFDFQLPMVSAAHRFGTTLENVPQDIPYLVAPATPALPLCLPRTLKVGIAWRGNPAHKNDRNRSIPLARWAPLWQVPRVSWYSLQVGEELPPDIPVQDLAPLIRDFADTAALVKQLDLVVSIDSAVAHLAGALGVAVFMLCPANPDFRWLLKGPVTPWYPTMRLFRQPVIFDWDTPMRELAQVIAGFTANEDNLQ